MTFARFGEYGVSVLAVPDETALDTIARTTLVKESALTLMTAGALRSIELELRPTFRRPHYTLMLPDLDADLRRPYVVRVGLKVELGRRGHMTAVER